MSFHLSEEDLYDYQNPREGFEKAQKAMGDIPLEEFFVKAGEEYKNIRELWLASLFGRGLSSNGVSCEIRLNEDDPPDFFVKTVENSCEYPFEITEKMKPGYKRGKEFKEIAGKEPTSSAIDIPDIKLVPGWICEAVEKKSKRYGSNSSGINLLVYVNVWLFEKLPLEAVRDACSEYQERFSSVWLLRDGIFAKLFSNDIFP